MPLAWQRYKGDPVVAEINGRAGDVVAEAFRDDGWHGVIPSKGAEYAFQSQRPIIPWIDDIMGRGHCRVYEESDSTIVTCHGDTSIPHREDPDRTERTIEDFCDSVYPSLQERVAISRSPCEQIPILRNRTPR